MGYSPVWESTGKATEGRSGRAIGHALGLPFYFLSIGFLSIGSTLSNCTASMRVPAYRGKFYIPKKPSHLLPPQHPLESGRVDLPASVSGCLLL